MRSPTFLFFIGVGMPMSVGGCLAMAACIGAVLEFFWPSGGLLNTLSACLGLNPGVLSRQQTRR